MASTSGPAIHGPRPGRSRDRRGRGARGPLSLPGPLSPNGVKAARTRRQEFAETVARTFESLRPLLESTGSQLEVAVEDAPLLPEDWPQEVPASTFRTRGGRHTVVIYRLPITQRGFDAEQTEALVQEIMVRRIADALGLDPEDLLDG